MRVFKIYGITGLFLLSTALQATQDSTAIQIVRPEDLMKRMGTDKFPKPEHPENLKIAVLDIGFHHKKPLKEYLPESAQIIDHDDYAPDLHQKCNFVDEPIAKRYPLTKIDHGLRMAQVVWTMLGKPATGPKFLLLNAAGAYNFKRALCTIITEKVDIVLYSQNWETGTNFVGGGFINKLVNHVLDRGIFWVNAAGNYANLVYNGPIKFEKDGWLKFRNGKDHLRFASLQGENRLAITLNWNDVGENEDTGTEKDLNLYVYDKAGLKSGTPLYTAEKIQVLNKTARGENETFLAREKIGGPDAKEDFGQGEYYIKVRAVGGTFYPKSDRIRVLVNSELGGTSDNLVFFDSTGDDEVAAPADNTHKYMFAVSDPLPTSSRLTTINGVQKPDILIGDSRMEFSGQFQGGASHAAAIFAGVLASMKLYKPDLDATVVRHFAKRTQQGQYLDTENEDARPVDSQEIGAKFGPHLAALTHAGSGDILVFRRRSSGRYVVGIKNDPSQLFGLFGALPADAQPREFAYYLSYDGKKPNGRLQISGHPQRKTATETTRPEPPPWLVTGRNEGDFLEVRLARLQPQIWLTPTPEELRRVVRQ